MNWALFRFFVSHLERLPHLRFIYLQGNDVGGVLPNLLHDAILAVVPRQRPRRTVAVHLPRRQLVAQHVVAHDRKDAWGESQPKKKKKKQRKYLIKYAHGAYETFFFISVFNWRRKTHSTIAAGPPCWGAPMVSAVDAALSLEYWRGNKTRDLHVSTGTNYAYNAERRERITKRERKEIRRRTAGKWISKARSTIFVVFENRASNCGISFGVKLESSMY